MPTKYEFIQSKYTNLRIKSTLIQISINSAVLGMLPKSVKINHLSIQ